MTPAVTHLANLRRLKRGGFSIGGSENNPTITGTQNVVSIGTDSSSSGQETLIRKAGHQIGRVFEGGADLVTAPVRWLTHMQENWLTYLVCITILLVCSLIIYYCIRRKISSFLSGNATRVMPRLADMVSLEERGNKTFRPALKPDAWNFF
ncbi:unnamed protein product [Rotaria socialis]|uniref:Uncharacterized protein n=1 Tax=Rotaria socialis TaxID=392032 RepID=A0A817PLH5_9BILA|nr:unnamed protein product [Rotaria socialis]CAF3164071.1 unnamed protein product [Rotaria socialis]CAF4370715.1 unnamed protein product [Rotaria socialis]CAF4484351.1 unnamed protein product [Rotaria socialis]CAF4739587.1 unnamed protein product [Rotaria socialis]